MKVSDFTDEQILEAIAGLRTMTGGRAYHVSDALGLFGKADSRAMYRRLCRLESSGKVRRDPRYSAVNSIYWVVAGDSA